MTDLLPGLPVTGDVRVAHLLRHTSGIADLLDPMRDPLNADLERLWLPDEVLGAVPGRGSRRGWPGPTRTRTMCCWA